MGGPKSATLFYFPSHPKDNEMTTNFDLVVKTNEVFNKPKGDLNAIKAGDDAAWARAKGCADCLQEELNELFDEGFTPKNEIALRDAICDILTFAYGVAHLAGFDANVDMKAVFDSNYSKLCATQEQLDASIAKYAAIGVEVLGQGTLPEASIISAKDQTVDGVFYPKGKFLKGVGFKKPVFIDQTDVTSELNVDDKVIVRKIKVNDSNIDLYDEDYEFFGGEEGVVVDVDPLDNSVHVDLGFDSLWFYREDLLKL